MRIIGYWVHWQHKSEITEPYERWRFFSALDNALNFSNGLQGPKWIQPEMA